MPRTLTIGDIKTQVATEEELLEFANAVRQAGGAGILEALLPSVQNNAAKCLIATSLNFGCTIDAHPDGKSHQDGSPVWAMTFPTNMTKEAVGKIIDQVPGARRMRVWDEEWIETTGEYKNASLLVMRLPKHIGNAALAFDAGVAFTEYRA